MKKILLFAFLLGIAPIFCMGQGFIYRPMNPAFGGNTFNYQWMLSSAQAQDTYKDPNQTSTTRTTTDPVADFATTLSRQTLSQLTRQLTQNQFGEGSLEAGTYKYGDLTINVDPGADGLVIKIVDNKGGETVITVPYY